MLYFIFTIDGDWKEYFDTELPETERLPKKEFLEELIRREIEVVNGNLKGRFIHFIHTSPRARNFFLEESFLKLWKLIIKNGGDVGLHCHEDDPYKDYYYQDSSRMRRVITERVNTFRKHGLDIECYRGGFLGFSDETVRILEENNIHFDFSCECGRYLTHGESIISDWRSAPEYHYKMDYNNHCKMGNSKVWEIPIGASNGRYLYFEKSDLGELEKLALDLKEQSLKKKCDIIVSVLTHTNEYISLEEIKSIEEKLNLLKKYGSFINIKELKRILT